MIFGFILTTFGIFILIGSISSCVNNDINRNSNINSNQNYIEDPVSFFGGIDGNIEENIYYTTVVDENNKFLPNGKIGEIVIMENLSSKFDDQTRQEKIFFWQNDQRRKKLFFPKMPFFSKKP